MPGDESDLSPLRQDAARMRDATMSGRDAYTASGNIYINQAPPQPAPPPAPAPGRGSGARAGGTGTDADSRGGGQAGLKSRMQRPELGFLGSPLGMTAAAVALIIVAICAFLAGRQSSGRPQAQHTVYVTVHPSSQPGPVATSQAPVSPSPSITPTQPHSSAPATPRGTALSSLTPVQTAVDQFKGNSPQPIGNTTYPNAIRFSCSTPNNLYSTYNSLVYEVAGYTTLTATIGIPSDATNAAGNSATIQFYKNGGSTQLGQTYTVSLDSVQYVSLELQGSAQLMISCQAAAQYGNFGDDIDVVIGTATLSKS